jgi:hypothetical protein
MHLSKRMNATTSEAVPDAGWLNLGWSDERGIVAGHCLAGPPFLA